MVNHGKPMVFQTWFPLFLLFPVGFARSDFWAPEDYFNIEDRWIKRLNETMKKRQDWALGGLLESAGVGIRGLFC